ncbi:hypothetical protein EWM64_g6440 [Hericium alpestre]|uniref:Uncharacterized protein n=1 Tax=Hericium alpestre TaxID=135208 RepID=A0A4Y9ZUQ2_9AGAM|nr:hypothetical protein EWM64_g6440 [Hericium alpestre]
MHYPPQIQPPASSVAQSFLTEQKSSVSQPPFTTPTKPKERTPSPTPSRELPQYWDAAIKAFLSSSGLTQALKGFEADMLVLNPEWERNEIPAALDELATDLKRLLDKGEGSDPAPTRSLEERKLDYVHLEKGAEPCSQASTNKSVALFLARNRARNDSSNRNEFLHAQKRRRLSSAEQSMSPVANGDERAPSCARTDAKTVDRDVMMKFDIARNEEGPLRRTMKTEEHEPKLGTLDEKAKARIVGEIGLTAERHPGVDERLQNIETHTAMRYVPSPPVSLLHRIQFIEDHIIQLEREYPPWAALHFNQPRRGVRIGLSYFLKQ